MHRLYYASSDVTKRVHRLRRGYIRCRPSVGQGRGLIIGRRTPCRDEPQRSISVPSTEILRFTQDDTPKILRLLTLFSLTQYWPILLYLVDIEQYLSGYP
jgi:hypothetical protein